MKNEKFRENVYVYACARKSAWARALTLTCVRVCGCWRESTRMCVPNHSLTRTHPHPHHAQTHTPADHTHTHTNIHSHALARTHTYTHIHTHTHKHTHTHTHTHTNHIWMLTGGKEGASATRGAGKYQGMCASEDESSKHHVCVRQSSLCQI